MSKTTLIKRLHEAFDIIGNEGCAITQEQLEKIQDTVYAALEHIEGR